MSGESFWQQKNLRYVREWEEAIAAVERSEAQVAFLMNPIGAEQVGEIVFGGEVLPQKSFLSGTSPPMWVPNTW